VLQGFLQFQLGQGQSQVICHPDPQGLPRLPSFRVRRCQQAGVAGHGLHLPVEEIDASVSVAPKDDGRNVGENGLEVPVHCPQSLIRFRHINRWKWAPLASDLGSNQQAG